MVYYTIEINKSGKYIGHCDECWYESVNEPLYVFTKEEVETVTNQMKQHYQYKFTVIGNDGSIDIINFLSKGNPMKTEETPKKKMFSFKTSGIKFNK